MSKKKDSFKPWLSRPTVNRSVTLPLTRPLTQRLSNLNEFHPNELDPYLLFDAQDSMIGTLENPTLDLDPSKPDTLNVITATRAGTATYTDVNGNIASAPANTVRVDQTQGAELTPTKFQRVRYTDFSSDWLSSNATISNAEPYEGFTAKRLSGTGFGFLYYQSIPVLSLTQYTVTFYARLVSGSSSNLNFYTSSTGSTYTSITLTSEWQKFTKNITTTSTSVNFGVANTGGSEPVVYEISQPQFEEGTTASDFVENTTGSPKFITGATFGPRVPMILVEPSATNIIYDSSAFITSGTSVKTTGFEAPDGTNTATKISNMQDATGIRAYSQITAVSGSTAYVGSIYLKGTAGETVRIEGRRQAGATFSSSGTQEITFDGTWQRVTNLAWTTAADNTAAFILIKNESGTTADEVYLWGSQLEQGAVSTSVIPTSGSTVTRADDLLNVTGSDFTDFFNNSQGTYYIEVIDRTPTIQSAYIFGQGVGQYYLYSNQSNNVDSFDGTNFQSLPGVVANQLFRAAATFTSAPSKNISVNGQTTGQGSFSSIPDTHTGSWGAATILKIGNGYGAGNGVMNGYVKRVIFWPYSSDNL